MTDEETEVQRRGVTCPSSHGRARGRAGNESTCLPYAAARAATIMLRRVRALKVPGLGIQLLYTSMARSTAAWCARHLRHHCGSHVIL